MRGEEFSLSQAGRELEAMIDGGMAFLVGGLRRTAQKMAAAIDRDAMGAIESGTDWRGCKPRPAPAQAPFDIGDALGLPRNNVKQLLFKMAKAGEVVKTSKKGLYSHPDHAGYSSDPMTPDNPDNHGNRRYWDDE